MKAFQSRYGLQARPELNDGKIQGQIKHFVNSQPLERAVALIEVFLQMDEPFFVKRCHDFVTFMSNLQRIGLALDTGADAAKPVDRGIEAILAEKAALSRAAS